MLRNMQKRDESQTLKPADVQRGLRSELKSIKLTSNFEDNIMKFQTIANKIDKIDEFELVCFFLEALDPRVRAELESSFMKPSINGKEYESKFRGQKYEEEEAYEDSIHDKMFEIHQRLIL
ncbi:hypothetical protein BpHYR1_005325 [Brachionus plicatilis]|uniref:Uncharacterized protein n=1 Tax=Brachionus plicatilis TaxID=10195 RepID=A0A3M7PG12_BRAPC|nr:hypothetical protein BpHYR1_005325 [Brachionus plicatilis]